MEKLFTGFQGGILGFLFALVPLIILHEIGHLLAAKKFKVWANEFGIGYPPRIMKLFRWQETEFTLNWLPLGGFVRLEGEGAFESPAAETEDAEPLSPEEIARKAVAREHSLYTLPPEKRIPIYLCGPLMNLVVAWVLCVVLYLTGVPGESVGIEQVLPDSPAQAAGLQAGDTIVAVDELNVATTTEFLDYIYQHRGAEMALTVRRSGVEQTVALTPRATPPEGEGPLGIAITYQGIKQYPPLPALTLGSQHFVGNLGLIAAMPLIIASENLSWQLWRPVGVIGISKMAGDSLQQSVQIGALYPYLNLAILLSLSLGIFNLLPIPALDGGRILFSIIEKVRARPLDPRLEEKIHLATLSVLMLLFLFITALDIFVPVKF